MLNSDKVEDVAKILYSIDEDLYETFSEYDDYYHKLLSFTFIPAGDFISIKFLNIEIWNSEEEVDDSEPSEKYLIEKINKIIKLLSKINL